MKYRPDTKISTEYINNTNWKRVVDNIYQYISNCHQRICFCIHNREPLMQLLVGLFITCYINYITKKYHREILVKPIDLNKTILIGMHN